MVGLCRSKYGEFKEYHTSLDNLSFISARGLGGALKACVEVVANLEANAVYKSACFCEPNLGKRGLYPTLSLLNQPPLISSFLAFCDDKNDVIDIAGKLGVQAFELRDSIKALLKHKLIKRVRE